MSNYPPGVTGSEWQIAGYPETVVTRDCGETVPVISALLLAELRTGVNLNSTVLTRNAAHALVAQADADAADERWQVECPWSGDVDAEVADGALWWTCPQCGTEHTEDAKPDYDDRDDSLEDES